jgi:hypothetical protein
VRPSPIVDQLEAPRVRCRPRVQLLPHQDVGHRPVTCARREKVVRLAQKIPVGPCTPSLWEYSYKRLKLVQLLGQLGAFFLLWPAVPSQPAVREHSLSPSASAPPGPRASVPPCRVLSLSASVPPCRAVPCALSLPASVPPCRAVPCAACVCKLQRVRARAWWPP